MAKIDINDLKVTYSGGKKPAVDRFSLTINDGELVVVLGQTGAGKTALLRTLCGLDPVAGGEIKIDDTIVNDYQPKDRNMAVVFKTYGLYPHLNVYDNLSFGLKMRKVSKAEIDKSVYYVSKLLGLEQLLNKRPKLLTATERARVSLGRSIIRQSNLILLDDPLSGYDYGLRMQLRNDILKVHQRLNATMLFSTRDAVEAITLADRIVYMEEGKIVQVGTPEEIYSDPANVALALYVGSPKINLIEGRISGEDGKFFTVGDVKLAADKPACKRCYLAVRPESVTLGGDVKATVKSAEKTDNDKYLITFTLAGDNKNYVMFAQEPLSGDIDISFNNYKFFNAETELPL